MGRRLVRLDPLPEPKYRNKRCVGPNPDGSQREYDSIKEATYAANLLLRAKAHDIKDWQPQVSIRLTVNGIPLRPYGGKRDSFYRADFIITHNDGSIECHDTKGYVNSKTPATMVWMLKLGILQAMHPEWRITVG